jgi:thiazole/oxazole-forming peptide maturase SagD family component
MTPWYASAYTGLFRNIGALSPRPHDPQLALHSGHAASWHDATLNIEASGIGWDADAAEGACVGEAVERLQPYALPDDCVIRASCEAWPLDEPTVPPSRWVLFHPDQYRQAEFPFQPLTPQTECDWVCCRQALTGDPWWVPAEFVWLHQRHARGHRICPGLSTGLACGRVGDPILLRGLVEVIERDAVVGALWGSYELQEFNITDVLDGLRPDARQRVLRPNLTYRCFRIVSPFSDHVMIVTLTGEDREGFCFSIGTACRETAAASWNKALLEAIHDRHYVRFLKQQIADGKLQLGQWPTNFAEHAVWYGVHPHEIERTIFAAECARGRKPFRGEVETVAKLAERLGPDRPVLFRSLTPQALASEDLGWHVLRVVVPGLQPLHGNHLLPHLGGPLWSPRGLATWREMPPHPMP